MNTVSPYSTLTMAGKFVPRVSNKTSEDIITYNLDTQNPGNLFPADDNKNNPDEIIPDFLVSTRTRESRSEISSGALDFNRWQYFVKGKPSSWGTIDTFQNRR